MPPPLDLTTNAFTALSEAHGAYARGAAAQAVFGPLLRAMIADIAGGAAVLVSHHGDGQRVVARAGAPDPALEAAALGPAEADPSLARLPLCHGERPIGAILLATDVARAEGPAFLALRSCAAALLHATRQAEEHAESEARRVFYQIAAQDERFVLWEWEARSDRLRYADPRQRRGGQDPEWREVPLSKLRRSVHREDLPQVLAGLRRQRAGAPGPYRNTLRVVYPDGSLRWFEGQAVLVRDGEGRPQRLLGVAMDITDRKKLESELLFRSWAVEQLGCALVMFDLELRFTYANRHAEELSGWRRDELLGRTPWHLVPRELIEATRAAMERVRRDGRWEGELATLRRDGQTRPILCSARLIHGGDGETLGILVVATDISERKRVEEQLRGALRERETLLREVHHRVKNNLQIISSLLHLQMGHSKNQRLRELLRDSQVRIRSMSLIHESLYQSPDLGDIDMGQYVRALVSSIAQSYLGRGQRIDLSVDASPLSVGLDAAIRLGLVVNELVVNAFKHGFPGRASGSVAVRIGRSGDEIVLCVEDDGVGPPADLDPERTTTIGLQLVTSLVGQMQGSFRLGRGARTRCEARVPVEGRGDHGA